MMACGLVLCSSSSSRETNHRSSFPDGFIQTVGVFDGWAQPSPARQRRWFLHHRLMEQLYVSVSRADSGPSWTHPPCLWTTPACCPGGHPGNRSFHNRPIDGERRGRLFITRDNQQQYHPAVSLCWVVLLFSLSCLCWLLRVCSSSPILPYLVHLPSPLYLHLLFIPAPSSWLVSIQHSSNNLWTFPGKGFLCFDVTDS